MFFQVTFEVINCYFIEEREAAEVSRILLLEDDEALGRGICMALETPDCTVTHCGTRRQATDILQNMVFDLLILDINLPDGSGLELLRALLLVCGSGSGGGAPSGS